MYKATPQDRQQALEDFGMPLGIELAKDNEWYVLASRIDWAVAEEAYRKNFPSRRGHPATPLRQVLGALIIQKRMGLSDRALVKAIAENPYYQYFIGLPRFVQKCPFAATTLVAARKRLDVEMLMRLNEAFLENASPTPEHCRREKKSGGKTGSAPVAAVAEERHGERVGDAEDGANGERNAGTMILDATCSPSAIRFPQDFSLLEEARLKTDGMIDLLHAQVDGKGARHPRTYRRTLRRLYLAIAKSKKRTAKAIRALIRKQLCALKRNLGFVDVYLARGGVLPAGMAAGLATIRKLYAQQKRMFDEKSHRVGDRIVSVSQPHLRPIVRGKAKAPVEFGAKYDVSIDEKGHARLERISFDAYNECTTFIDAVERYKERTGHYPRRALVDKIYRTRENRQFCNDNGIKMSGRGPGRRKESAASKASERQEEVDRIEVERFFSREKRTCGAALIVAKLSETTLGSIALSVLVANLFGIPMKSFFVIYLLDETAGHCGCYWCEFTDAAA